MSISEQKVCGNVLHGAMMGLLSAGSGEGMMAVGGSLKTGMKVAIQSVIGGTLSELGGGNFANGAITAAFSFLFNHVAHQRLVQAMIERNRELVRMRLENKGFLTLEDAKLWYLIGNGESLHMDPNNLELDNYLTRDSYKYGDEISINLFNGKGDLKDAVVYGQIKAKFQYMDAKYQYFKIDTDVYDFDMHNWTKEFFRNIGTVMGKIYNGKGKPFQIIFDQLYKRTRWRN